MMKKLTMSWEREGFTLRSFEPGQADRYYSECMSKVDPETDRLTGTTKQFDRDQVVRYYDRIVDDPDRYDFILISPDGKMIGESVINEIDWDCGCANFRIVIFDSGNCSRGLGTWMVEKTRDFAFEQLKLHRLELDVFSFNLRARHVYEKAGFRVEGIRRDAIRDGEGYGDDILMAILEEEWRKLRETV